MDVLMLRLLLDASFFMAIFNPLISGSNQVLRWGLLAVLTVWLIWIVMNWKKKDLVGRIQDIALAEAKMLGVIQIYEVVLQGFADWQKTCAPYVVVFIVAAILFLRAGRLAGGSQEKHKFWGANGVEMFLIVGTAVACSSEAAKKFAWKLLGNFYMKLVLPVLMVFLNLMQAVFMLLEPFIAALFSDVEFEEYQVVVDNRTGQDFLKLTGEEALAETPLWAKIAGAVIVAVILAVVFYFLYKKLSVSGSGRDRKIHGEVKKSTIAAGERKTLKKPSLFEEKNVRYYYRKFLALCKKHDLEPESDMVTTEMMRIIAGESWGDEASVDEFTNLYRDVRYGGQKDEEPERKTAKALFKKMKNIAESKESA